MFLGSRIVVLTPRPEERTGAYLDAGADIKYGITSNITVDATVNPDFGQVEADPAVLNLSAFEQFFEERRPFFLEGSGIFSFKTACGALFGGEERSSRRAACGSSACQACQGHWQCRGVP